MELFSIFPGTRAYHTVYKLYLLSFPKEERKPFFRLWLLSRLHPEVTLRGYGEDGHIFGFSLTVCSEHYHYIAYMAVAPDRQGTGWGGEILNLLRREHPQPLLVEVESPDQACTNLSQRQRRQAFYLRNGFVPLEHGITGNGVKYRLLSTDTQYDRSAYLAIFQYLSFGIRKKLGSFQKNKWSLE